MYKYAFLAIHGGQTEIGTSEITKEISSDKFPYFINSENQHVTSTKFESPLLSRLLNETQTIISIHGEKNTEESYVIIGGLNSNLGLKIKKELEKNNFIIHKPEKKLAGKNKNNFCNKGLLEKGVQLEISNKLRINLLENKSLMKKFCHSITATLT